MEFTAPIHRYQEFLKQGNVSPMSANSFKVGAKILRKAPFPRLQIHVDDYKNIETRSQDFHKDLRWGVLQQ